MGRLGIFNKKPLSYSKNLGKAFCRIILDQKPTLAGEDLLYTLKLKRSIVYVGG